MILVVLVSLTFVVVSFVTDHIPIKEIRIWSHNGQLFLEWKHNNTLVSEYVIEWVYDGKIDWQRESKTTRQTAIKGNLKNKDVQIFISLM